MPRRLITAVAAAAALSLLPTAAQAALQPPTGPTGTAPVAQATTTTTGTLHVAVGDDFAGGKDVYIAEVSTDDGVLDVPPAVTDDLDPSLESGDQVEVTTNSAGTVTDVEAAPADDADHSNDGADVAAGASPVAGLTAAAGVSPVAGVPASGQHYVTVIPVAWAGVSAAPATNVQKAVTNLDTYYNTISNGHIRVSLKATTPTQNLSFTPSAAGTCSTARIDDALKSVYTSGTYATPANAFTHVVFLLPNAPKWCSFAGYGSIGKWSDGRNHMWLFDTLALTNAVFAHEFGHNLGLEHSGAVQCSFTTAKVALPLGDSSCVNVYGDPWDIMGNSTYAPYALDSRAPDGIASDPIAAGFMSAPNLARLGLISSTDQKRVTSTSSTVTLHAVASRSGLRLVTIPWGTRTFTLEFRAATGLDNWINTPNGLGYYASPSATTLTPFPAAGSGVVLRERDGSGINSQDGAFFFHPETGQAAIRAGETKGTADGSLRVRVNAITGTGAASTASVTIVRAADKTAPTISGADLWSYYKPAHVGATIDTSTLGAAWSGTGDADSAVSSVSLVVDGRTRATAGPAANTQIRAAGIKDGTHKWHLVVRDVFGNARATADQTVKVDTVKPKVTTSPRAYLTKGTVSTKTLPVVVKWSASDACGVVWNSVAGSNGLKKSFWGKPKSVSTRLKYTKSQFAVRVEDCMYRDVVSYGPKTKPTLDKQSKRKGYHGTWTATKAKKSLGGTEQVTKKKKAYVTYKVKARSIGWVATTGKDRGKAAVYVDGKKVAVVNLHASKTHYAQQVFTKTFSKAGTHTIKIVNLSSKKVGVDAFTRLS